MGPVGIPVLSRQGDPDPRMTRDRERARWCKGRCGYFVMPQNQLQHVAFANTEDSRRLARGHVDVGRPKRRESPHVN